MEKLTASFVQELPSILGIIFFFGAAYFSFFALLWTDAPTVRLFFLATLVGITSIRAIQILSSVLFSLANPEFRIMPLQCGLVMLIHRMLVGVSAYIIIAMLLFTVIKKLGAVQPTISLLQLLVATLLLVITGVIIITHKERVKSQILEGAKAYGDEPSWGRRHFASIWHIPALVYLLCLWLLLFSDLVNTDQHTRGAFILSFFVVPIWLLADLVVQWIVKYAMSTLKIHQDQYDETVEVTEEELEARERGKKSFLRAMVIARIGLVFGLGIWVASLWNLTVPFISRLSTVLFDALLIMTMALLFWQFISSWIERKIKESLPEEEGNEEDKDDEWGAAAQRGRSYTLLPMVRKFIGTVLFTMVVLTLLSALGVDIGPLLAGAGVIGLAVGFGAQKLVADMFSGFFYLLDDAFRVGEYIEAAGVSGAVENITLRNVMLRHHRGMLQIVPHSELGSITNFMRGGIVVKFNLDFPYDADIDQIRKIIKKVGQAMLQDEELGEDFIRPVKSQGVREISNSVMTIRVKFTAKPGTHFVIRREAYRRITDALRAKGIEYAHRKVIVDVPIGDQNGSPDQVAKTAGAAAERAIQEEQSAQPAPAKSGPTLPD